MPSLLAPGSLSRNLSGTHETPAENKTWGGEGMCLRVPPSMYSPPRKRHTSEPSLYAGMWHEVAMAETRSALLWYSEIIWTWNEGCMQGDPMCWNEGCMQGDPMCGGGSNPM